MSDRKKLWLTTSYNTTAQAVADILHFTFIYSNSLAHVSRTALVRKWQKKLGAAYNLNIFNTNTRLYIYQCAAAVW